MLDTLHIKTMLGVEDDDALRGRLAISVQKRGFEIRTSVSVADGLTALESNAPGCAIIDVRILDRSGLNGGMAIKGRDSEARAINLTGYGDISTAVAAVRVGGVDYHSKHAPVDPICRHEARLEHIEHDFHQAGGNVARTDRLLNKHSRTSQRVLRRLGGSADATQ